MKRIVFAVLLAVMSMPAFAAQAPEENICHFDLDYGVWELISISGNAVDKHLNNHDDGLPGGETVGTNTQLDETCAPPRTLTCPCWAGKTVEGFAAEIDDWEDKVDFPNPTTCERTTDGTYDQVKIRLSGYNGSEKGTAVSFLVFAKVNTDKQEADCEIDTDVPIFYTAQTGTAPSDLDWGRACVAELDEVRQAVTICPEP